MKAKKEATDTIFGDKFILILQVQEEIKKESDRGCCLMAAAFLEEQLQELLTIKLVGTKKFIGDLFEFNGPLGTFSAKIKLSYSLGLIGSQELQDLDIIRKIRNEFGHKHQPINFNTNELRNRIKQLKSHLYDSKNDKPRDIFTNTVMGLVAQIQNSYLYANKFNEKPSIILNDKDKKLLNEWADEMKNLQHKNKHPEAQ